MVLQRIMKIKLRSGGEEDGRVSVWDQCMEGNLRWMKVGTDTFPIS